MCTGGAKDKKGGARKPGTGGKAMGDEDDDAGPRALQVDLSVRLCLLTCDADAQLTAPAAADAAAAGDAGDN